MPQSLLLEEVPALYDATAPRDPFLLVHPLDGEIARCEARLLQLIAEKQKHTGQAFTTAPDVKRYLRALLAGRTLEQTIVLWLDVRHRLLGHEVVSLGTLAQATVHPRRLLEGALRHNAGACILAHNHPSGVAEPSACDDRLTRECKELLQRIDVRLLDHIVVAGASTVSYAERGLL